MRTNQDHYQLMANFILAALFQHVHMFESLFTFGFLRCPLVLAVFQA